MAQTGIYGPATFQRNITLANLVLTLDAAGAAPVVTKDKGLIVSTVENNGAGDWVVTLNDTYVNGVDIAGIAVQPAVGSTFTVEIVSVTNNSIVF